MLGAIEGKRIILLERQTDKIVVEKVVKTVGIQDVMLRLVEVLRNCSA